MNSLSPSECVLDQVATWSGVSTEPTPRGATAIMFAGHELGHVHRDRRTLDFPLPAGRRKEVLDARRAQEWFANYVSKPLTSETDAQDAIALLRESYEQLSRP
jgi:Luciferase